MNEGFWKRAGKRALAIQAIREATAKGQFCETNLPELLLRDLLTLNQLALVRFVKSAEDIK